MQGSFQYTVMDAAPVRAIDSSTNASPIVITDAAHGLATGDTVTIISHAVNTAANGTWTVTRVSANEFSLDDSTGNGIGAGTGSWAKMTAPAIFIQDAETVSITVDTDGGGDAAMTLKLWTSDQEEAPDAALAQSASNQYDFVDMIDKEDGASIDGDTGFAVAAADDHRQFVLNDSGSRWAGIIATAGTAGEVTVKFRLFNRNI
jgi:hypothetical protein